MGCLKTPVWRDYSREELLRLKAEPLDEMARARVRKNWDAVAKPLDGMGRFEELTAQIGGITGTERLAIDRKAILVMCADNGIVEEGVSQSGQEVTAAVAASMAAGKSSVCRMARAIRADVIPVDIGICQGEPISGLWNRKIRRGTRNFRREPAMTEKETICAIAVGIDMAAWCAEDGVQILGLGEMGIGNTTTSSAVTAALLGCSASEVTGRGAGLDDEGLARKRKIIADAIEKYDLYRADALTVLQTVGGLDIAGLAGACIGGALFHIPVVADGVISLAAALVAEKLVPGTREYILPSHRGKEPAAGRLEKELKLEPVIDAQMALGEGTGAVMMLSLLDLALSVYCGGTTFNKIRIEPYQRVKD